MVFCTMSPSARCPFGTMSFGKMSFRRDVFRQDVFRRDVLSARCPSTILASNLIFLLKVARGLPTFLIGPRAVRAEYNSLDP